MLCEPGAEKDSLSFRIKLQHKPNGFTYFTKSKTGRIISESIKKLVKRNKNKVIKDL